MSDTVKINGVIFEDVEYIKVQKYIQPVEGEPEPEPEYAYYRHTRNLTSPINIAEVFAGTATEINDFNGEINGVLGTRIMNNNDSIQSLILPAVTATSGETCRYCDNLRYVKMDSCRSVTYRAFRECPRLEEIDFPVLTSVAEEAFYSCGSLTDIKMPELLSVGVYGFGSCGSLKEVTLPKVTTLYGHCFRGDGNLETLNLPSLTTLSGSCLFYGDSKLLTMDFSKVTSASGEYCFEQCFIQEVNIPLLTGVNYRLFRNSRIKRIILAKVTWMSSQPFYDCTVLQYVHIPNMKSTINEYSFYNCQALTALVLGEYVAPLANNTNIFTSTPIANGTGYVYVGLFFLEWYRNAANWITYASQILPLEMLEDDTSIEYNVLFALPANCRPKIHFETSKCELYCNGVDFCNGNNQTKIILGDTTDTLQYTVECPGFVSTSGSIAISDTDTDIPLDLSDLQIDANFNGFSLVNIDWTAFPINLSNYATFSGSGFASSFNYHDIDGISGFSSGNYINVTITFPDYSGMTNPVFLWEAIIELGDSLSANTGGVLYSMGGSNTNQGTISISYNGFGHYANGSRISVSGLDLEGKHHVALAVTSTTVYLYIDGELINSYSDTYLINGMKYTTPRIGNNQNATGEYFHGKLLRLCQTVRDIADPSVYANCDFMLDGAIPQG